MGLLNDDGTYNIDWDVGGDAQPGVNGAIGTSGVGTLTPDAFNQMITDASSFSLTIDSGSRNAIQWIAAKDRILIGTSGGEWRLSGHSNKPLTPTNYDIKVQTVWGSKDMQPLVLHEAVLFVDYVGKKLREMIYNGTEERYLSPDLLLLAEHITKSGGITTMAYQRHPDSIIWATLANGELISCTYVREQDVVAWARHPLSMGSEIDDDEDAIYIPPVSTDYPLLRATTDQADPQLPHVTAISNVQELQAMEDDLDGNYYLTNDIDASDTITWNAGAGFDPVGNFTGTLDGCDYTISNLYINKYLTVGLFSTLEYGAEVANLTLSDIDYTGFGSIGGLVGVAEIEDNNDMLIQNVHVTGTIKTTVAWHGLQYTGGFVGRTYLRAGTGIIYYYDCSADVILDQTNCGADNYRGGFVGSANDCVVFSNCYATGDITNASVGDTASDLGGFGGRLEDVTCSYCYATGNVDGGEDYQSVGGFAGLISSGSSSISKCYATGTASGDFHIGGFVGEADGTNADFCTDCYARGSATAYLAATSGCGGFCGSDAGNGNGYTNCYSIGAATGTDAGGFIGTTDTLSSSSNSYWDTEASGNATTDEDIGDGKTTIWLKTKLNYPSAWDFDTIWRMAGTAPWIDADNSNAMGANSVCVIPGSTEDEVWVSVARAIDGNLVRYIERMKPRYWGTDQEDVFFVDSGLTYDSTPANNFTGLGHLEGETVAILGDGGVFPTQVVTGGTLPENLDQTVSVAHIGLPYTYKLKPMRSDQNIGGTTKGSIKVTAEAVVSFYKTLNARYGNGTDSHGIDFRTTEAYTTPPALYTGDKLVNPDAGYSVEDPFQIEGSDPLPCTVRCIIPRIEKTGR